MSTEKGIIYPGILLLSEPFMPDPHFKRTVVLICEYNKKDGAVGFIINRSMGMRVCDAMMDVDKVNSDIFYGGPVAQNNMHYLHQYGDIIEDSMHVVDDVYWGGNFDQITEMLKEGLLDPRGIKFLLGYSGWSSGQLEEEMEKVAGLLLMANLLTFLTPKRRTSGRRCWKIREASSNRLSITLKIPA